MRLVDYVFLSKILPESYDVKRQTHDLVMFLKDNWKGVKVKDRMYHLRTYKQCFVARKMTTWLSNHFTVERKIAVRIGLFLQEKGYIEHWFKDEYLFFRWLDVDDDEMQLITSPGTSSLGSHTRYAYVMEITGITTDVAPVKDKKSKTQKLIIPYCKVVIGDEIITTDAKASHTFIHVVSVPTNCSIAVLNEAMIDSHEEDLIGYVYMRIEKDGEGEFSAPIVQNSLIVGQLKFVYNIRSILERSVYDPQVLLDEIFNLKEAKKNADEELSFQKIRNAELFERICALERSEEALKEERKTQTEQLIDLMTKFQLDTDALLDLENVEETDTEQLMVLFQLQKEAISILAKEKKEVIEYIKQL